MNRIAKTAALLLLTTGLGCWSNHVPTTPDFCDFTGTVTVQGKPADRVGMYFTKVDPAVGRDDVCQVNGGKYTIKLMAGKYKVSFQSAGGTAIPKPFQSPTTSGFELDASRKDGQQNFELK